MPFASINDIQLHYQIYGSPDKKTLVLLNGLGASSSGWTPQIDAFSFHFQVIVLDNRGVGLTQTSFAPFSIQTMASDVIQLLQHLNISKASFLGTSMGGRICQEIALLSPLLVESLIIASSTANPISLLRSYFIFETYSQMLLASVSPEIRVRYMLPWVFTQKFFEKEALVSTCIQSCLESESSQNYNGYCGQLAALKTHKAKSQLKAISLPTLILSGGDDLVTPFDQSQELASLIPNSKLVKIEGGHGISQEYPEVYNHHVLHFLLSFKN